MGDGRVTDAAAAMTSAEEMIERRIFFFSFYGQPFIKQERLVVYEI